MDMAIIPWQMVLLCGLSVCVGWGIRGNFGHEYGAALAGALGAMAIALLSGREDWWRMSTISPCLEQSVGPSAEVCPI